MRIFLQRRSAPSRVRHNRVEFVRPETPRNLPAPIPAPRRAPPHGPPAPRSKLAPPAPPPRSHSPAARESSRRSARVNVTCAMHPAKNATRARRRARSPEKSCPSSRKKNSESIRGSSSRGPAIPKAAEFRVPRAAPASPRPADKAAATRATSRIRSGYGKQPPINKIARHPRSQRPRIFLLDLRPRQLEQLSVFHARRARRLARPAIQAAINVRDKRFAQFQAAPDPPAASAESVRAANPLPAPTAGTSGNDRGKPAVHAPRVIFVYSGRSVG